MVTPDGATAYNYDELGNLLGVTLPDGKAIEYVVDAKNRRVVKKVDGTVQYRLLYKDQLNPVAKVDGSGNTLETYVYGTKANIPDYIEKDGEKYRIISDHLGSPRLVVKVSDGSIVRELEFDEFGNVTKDEGEFDMIFGFAGGLYDAETGLVRFGARDYLSEIGRWVQKDPIRFDGGTANLYEYCGNDPVNFVDPSGFYSLLEFGGDALNFVAGLGNAVSFGASTWIAEQLMSSNDAATLRRVKQCSGAFEAGEWASLALGLGRVAYAGVAKGASLFYALRGATMKNAMSASAFRNVLKKVFRLNPFSKFRVYPFGKMVEKYKTADAIISAAGRTNSALNKFGAISAAGGATTLSTK